MAQLIVRNIDTDLKTRLQMQAKYHGRSMEEEVRSILARSVFYPNKGAGELIASFFSELSHNEILETFPKQSLKPIDFGA